MYMQDYDCTSLSSDAAQSSSPGSGSFHTANPMDSERSSLADHSEGDEWDGEGREDHSSVEVQCNSVYIH